MVIKMKKMFNKDIIKKCAHCLHSTPLANSGEMACKIKGIVFDYDLCRKYKYDPLKRVPKTTKLADNYVPDNFIL